MAIWLSGWWGGVVLVITFMFNNHVNKKVLLARAGHNVFIIKKACHCMELVI